ncbi:melanopsin-like [Parasteatoda tepidariorum]|uniref:melanopsin-like n=1 Tax=Parasteatoda tepidariorum TaxID=114398 RepID=UPI00077FCCEE|nr:melanopsin-like [Parasteatoda tepidariorum]
MDEDEPSESIWTGDYQYLSNSTTSLYPPTIIATQIAVVDPLLQNPIPAEIFRYIQIISLSLITILGFVSNFLVLLLFYRKPTLRSFSNRFVLNLTISHFWQCILTLPTTVMSVAAEKWLFGDITCIISGFLFITLIITSVLTLLLIALDRNFAVNSPLHYTMTITKKRTGFLIFMTWFIGVLVASPPFFGVTDIKYRPQWHMCTLEWEHNETYSLAYGSVLIVLGFMVPFLTTICVYSSMFQAARDNSERARKHSVNSTIVESTLPETSRVSSLPPKKKYRRWSSGSNQFFGEEWKAVRTGLLVVMTFTLCWLPYFTVTSLETYFYASNKIPDYVLFIVILCSSSACIINPYLYVFRNKTSRKHIKQIICPTNLTKNKKWIFQKENRDKSNPTTLNPCILTASLENEGSEKVKALPALYQDIDGQWQVFSTSEERSRDDIDETVSNVSDDDFFDSGIHSLPTRKTFKTSGGNVQAIYNNSFTRSATLKNTSITQGNASSKLLLFRMKTSVNRDSTSSDTTDNCSISLESTNSNEQHGDSDVVLPSRRGIGKYLFNTSEELFESRPAVTYHKKPVASNDEQKNTSETRKGMSSFGSARRKSFIHSHIRHKKSSETTLTSSTASETLDSSSANSLTKSSSNCNRPKLIRQVQTIEPPEEHSET